MLMLACLLLVRLGLTTADDHPLIATFAPAAGLAWAALMRWGPAVTPGVWLGLAAGFIWGGASWSLALALATGQTLGACIAAFWLGRAGFDSRLDQPRDLWLLGGAVLCGGAVLSAANAATWLMLAGRIPMLDLANAWLAWWFGEASGLVIVGVALLALPRVAMAVPSTPRWIGDAALLLAIALSFGLVIDALANGRLNLLPFAVLPLVALAWLALRGGLALPTFGLAVLALLATALLAGGSRSLQQVAGAVGIRSMWACLALAQALVLLVHVFAGRARNAAQRFELALESADLGVADWPLGVGTPYTSARWRSLLGDRDGSRTSTLEAWLARVHGDDRNDLRLAIESLDQPAHDSVWRQARIRVGDAWPWFELRITVAARDAGQRPTRLVATLSDVQEQRSAEDRERLSSSLFQNLHEGLVIVDADLRILDVNPTYSRITGHRARGVDRHRADAAQLLVDRRDDAPAAERHLGRLAQPRTLERRGGRTPAQRRSLRVAPERVHGARPRRRRALSRADGVGHHRAAAAARTARAPGPFRRADATAQPRAPDPAAQRGAGGQRTRRPSAGRVLHRPRSLQGDQRAPRPQCRRPPVGGAGCPPAQRAARARHLVRRRGATGRRRVRAAAARRHGRGGAAGRRTRAARDRAAVHARCADRRPPR